MTGLDEPVVIEAKHLQEVGGGAAPLNDRVLHASAARARLRSGPGRRSDRRRRAAPPQAPSHSGRGPGALAAAA